MLSLDQGEGKWAKHPNFIEEHWINVPTEHIVTAACISAYDPSMKLFHGAVRTTWPHERERLNEVHVTLEKDRTVLIVHGEPTKNPAALWQGNMAVLWNERETAEKLIELMSAMAGLLKPFIVLGYDLMQKHPEITQGVNGSLAREESKQTCGTF